MKPSLDPEVPPASFGPSFPLKGLRGQSVYPCSPLQSPLTFSTPSHYTLPTQGALDKVTGELTASRYRLWAHPHCPTSPASDDPDTFISSLLSHVPWLSCCFPRLTSLAVYLQQFYLFSPTSSPNVKFPGLQSLALFDSTQPAFNYSEVTDWESNEC